MIAFAVATGPPTKAGVVAVAVLAALALVARGPRVRAGAMLGALILAPILLLTDIWSSPQLHVLHRHPLVAVVGALVAIGVLAAAAVVVHRHPTWIAPLAVAALPFRVPIQSGDTTSNLLVPLYGVVAVGALAQIGAVVVQIRREREARLRAARADDRPPRRSRENRSAGRSERENKPARAGRFSRARLIGSADAIGWMERLLALYLVLYGIQSTYAPLTGGRDIALQNMVFFYVPFALLYRLLRDMTWDGGLIRRCLLVTIVLAIAFSLIGFYEYDTKTIFLNSKLALANQLHTYFTVNSVFLDPDIFGRYLALVMIVIAGTLLVARPRRDHVAATLALAVLWAGLVLTLSRSSLGALLVGLAILAGLRWKPSRALVAALAVVAVGAAAVAVSPNTFGLNQGVNGASSGRGGLVSGGLSLFGDRPVWGYGSGSFVAEYRAHHKNVATTLSASHTIPITVAAEQGLIGLLSYALFVVAAIACLLRGARGDPVRCAIAAAFIALVFHTLLYADFLEDPTTWTLLGIGAALAASVTPGRAVAQVSAAPALAS